MKKARILTARLILFAVVCVWILGLLGFSILFWDHMRELLLGEGMGTWLESVYAVWIIFTVICAGLYAFKKGVSLIFKWDKE